MENMEAEHCLSGGCSLELANSNNDHEEDNDDMVCLSGILLCLLGFKVHSPKVINKQFRTTKFVNDKFESKSFLQER